MRWTYFFSVMLLAAAVLLLILVLRSIRRSKLVIADSLFWFFFAAVLVLLAIWPDLAYQAATLLGIQSPINLVYLVVIAALVWRQFGLTLRISALNSKLEDMAQQVALDEHDREQKQ